MHFCLRFPTKLLRKLWIWQVRAQPPSMLWLWSLPGSQNPFSLVDGLRRWCRGNRCFLISALKRQNLMVFEEQEKLAWFMWERNQFVQNATVKNGACEVEWGRKDHLLATGLLSDFLTVPLVLPICQAWLHSLPETQWPGEIAAALGGCPNNLWTAAMLPWNLNCSPAPPCGFGV